MSSIDNMKISLQDILLATNEFAEANIIARGGFGNVYRGQSEQHGILAIKRLDRVHGQGDREFGVEIQLLTIYKHENLVSLVGFCEEGGEKILVYKYETNGSLDRFLHKKDLTWERRLQICLDAARGLRYLHDEIGAQHRVIHRDIKSANILLDENWRAKISDFGLSKIALANVPVSFLYSAPCGTYGYVDPEFLQGSLTQKSDVYSFGVVLFEVLFGKLVGVAHNLDNRHHFTVEMAQNHHQNKTLDKIIDPDLWSQISSVSLSTFSTIAYQCLKNSRADRPTMSLVVEELQKALGHQQDYLRQKEPSAYLHDVFICYRMKDTDSRLNRDKFVDALERNGLSTYQGNISASPYASPQEIEQAIQQSRSFIIIFSKDFALSAWELDEVAKITECIKEKTQVIVPIFNGVYPSDVRTQSGHFGEAMSQNDWHPRLKMWKKALLEVTNKPEVELDYIEGWWVNEHILEKVVAKIKGRISGKDYLELLHRPQVEAIHTQLRCSHGNCNSCKR